MRFERPRRRAAGNRLHHWRFHFQVPAFVKELPQRAQHFGSLHKHFAALKIREQVHVALAVANLLVRQPMKLLRQRQHRLGQEGQPLRMNRKLSRARAEQVANHANVVAQIQQLVKRESLLAHCVQPHVDLQPLAALLQSGKARLALCANSHDASRHRHGRAVGFQLFAGRLIPFVAHVSDGVRGRELVGISRLSQLLDLLQLAPAQFEQPALKL